LSRDELIEVNAKVVLEDTPAWLVFDVEYPYEYF